jgi:hypothetical protein
LRRLTRAQARVLLGVGVALGLALLPALAHASPPDPSWLPGVWDASDDDDAVALLYSVLKAVAAPAASHDWLPPGPIDRIPPHGDDRPAAPLRHSVRSRAPPLA